MFKRSLPNLNSTLEGHEQEQEDLKLRIEVEKYLKYTAKHKRMFDLLERALYVPGYLDHEKRKI